MGGTLIFLMMTEWPEMAVATSRPLMPRLSRSVRIASTTAPWFMMAPSTMVCAGRGSKPKLTSCSPFEVSLIWTTLTELDPISSPMQFLAIGDISLWYPALSYLYLHCALPGGEIKKVRSLRQHIDHFALQVESIVGGGVGVGVTGGGVRGGGVSNLPSTMAAKLARVAAHVDAVFLDLVEQRAVADFEQLRGAGAVAAGLVQGAADERFFRAAGSALDGEVAVVGLARRR